MQGTFNPPPFFWFQDTKAKQRVEREQASSSERHTERQADSEHLLAMGNTERPIMA